MAPHRRLLLAAGSNAKGQLGVGSHDDAHTFTPCRFAGCKPNPLTDPAATVAQIACGANHTVALLQHPSDGSTTLWGTGDGRQGQLGTGWAREVAKGEEERDGAPAPGTTVFRALVLPHRQLEGYACKAVAAAWETTYVVLARAGCSDVVLAMGSNAFGALGVGVGEGTDPADPGSGPSGRTSSAGVGHARVVDFGHLLPPTAGHDAPPGTVRVRALHAGPRHVVAQLDVARADGSSRPQTLLIGWGASRHGQLGQHGGQRFVARPTRLPIDIDDDPMVSCALGNQHTVVLHASGRISALGSNKQGQIPSSLRGVEPIWRLGCTWNSTFMHTIGGGKHVLRSTGNNAQGQLGYTARSTSVVDGTVNLPVDRPLTSFVCGSEHVLAVMTSSTQEGDLVMGWGWNEHGNMGLGSVSNITVPTQLWPREDVDVYDKYPQRVIGIWAGCATSWLLVE